MEFVGIQAGTAGLSPDNIGKEVLMKVGYYVEVVFFANMVKLDQRTEWWEF